jgi:hypothetical protein
VIHEAEDGLMALPNAEGVEVTIVVDADGQWLVEMSDGSRRPAEDGERLTVAGETWELMVPPVSPIVGTYKEKTSLRLSSITLRFYVSLDEEHVRIEAVDENQVVSLGERACFDLLLLLARTRLKDAARGTLPEGEHGWIHMQDLIKGLGKEERSINTDAFRVREIFAKANIDGFEGIVERRRQERRIGTGRLDVRKA